MPEEVADASRPRGKSARVKRGVINGSGNPHEVVASRLSEDDDRAVRDAVTEARERLKAILGRRACSYSGIAEGIAERADWVQKKLSKNARRWSLTDALLILKGIEVYASPLSPPGNRNAEISKVLVLVRLARMRLLEAYSLPPAYYDIRDRIQRASVESGAVKYASDPRVEAVLRPLYELFASVHESVVVETTDGTLIAATFLPDPATKGKMREHQMTFEDGSRMSTFKGDSRAWMGSFIAPSFVGRINPDLIESAKARTGAKRVQSEASEPTSGQPSTPGKPRKTRRS